ncbi:LCP family protein [Brachybacterium huguangmaarense]|uniref:LCP family protein n=1 Tax=Brachybacterium huguangmaarense TaxID=1652028 RepID=A0ABY6FXW5_9MICO|nr:LCP family protein [Brachybacterium huguangmaarense]UYG15692.1 LCP family protein [Brachybacterium huguangmaarense]
MDERDQPRSPRPGDPRRPARHRARPGGSARPVPSEPAAPSPSASSRPHGVHHHAASGPDAVDPAEAESLRTPSGSADGSSPRPRRRRSTTAGRLSRIPRPLRLGVFVLVLIVVVSGAWVTGLGLWANSRIEHVDALSGAADTPGTTYLIAGSDQRGGTAVADDGTQGGRADTMMLLHKAPNGNSYLVSLPRDTLVDVPGKGRYKLNAAYALGGPALLVKTVEEFTGLTIDHFVEIGFDGVSGLVDAVGTVNLCIDQDVEDPKSGLKMTKGCHDTGGEQALAFVRARYFDPTADLGRQKRQQQFVGALLHRVMSPGVLLNPVAQVRLAAAGTGALRTDDSTGILTLGRMGLAMRRAMADSTTLTMPIEDENYHTKNSGVAILTDDDEIAAFFSAIEDGTATAPAAG